MSATAFATLPAPTVRLIPPDGERTAWIAQRADGTLLRIGADAATLLDALERERDRDQLVGRLGAPWTAEAVDAALVTLGKAGLVDAGQSSAPAPSRAQALRWVPPASLQLTLIRDPRRLNALRGRLTWILSRPIVGLQLLIAAAGLAALFARHTAVVSAATSPLSPAAVAAVILATVFLTSLHELGHGAALVAYGGRVRRFGVMIFYASLAMFCDVTDAWLLSSRRSARNVALAGGLASTALAGVCSLAAAAAPPAVALVLTLVALIAYVGAVINLIPLVKFDGYVALVLAKGENHLRARAMNAWVDALAGRHSQTPPAGWDRGGLIAFGLGCSLFPLLLIGASAVEVSRSLEHLGPLGAAGQLVIAALVGALALQRAISFVKRTSGRGLPWRVPIAVLGAVLAATVSAGLLLKAPVTTSIPYVQTGTSVLLAPNLTAPHVQLSPGERVRLDSVGLLASRHVGTAVVISAHADGAEVPSALRTPALQIGGSFSTPVIHATAPAHRPRVGYGRVNAGRASVLSRSVHEFVLAPVEAIVP